MSARRSLIMLAIIVLLMPVCAFSVTAAQMMRNRAPAQNFQFYAVQQGDVKVYVTGIGTVEADSVANLTFSRPGRVLEIIVQEGDYVSSGDLLVRLENTSETLSYERALLSLKLAELQRDELLKPVDEDAIRIAEANLQSAWGAYQGIQNAITPEDIQAAELRYQQALQAETDAIEARTSAAGGQVDQAYALLDAQVGAASFNAEIARLQLESLRNGNSGSLGVAYSRVLQAERELDRIKAGPTQAEIDQAEIAVEQAQSQVDAALQTLNEMKLVAPFEGVISRVNVEVGAVVISSISAVQITDVTPLHVDVQVDEIDIREVEAGMDARVELDALTGLELDAHIDRIALVPTNNNGIISYDVRVNLTTVDPRVLVGMTAEAGVIVDSVERVLVVPNEYIRLDRQRNQAFVNLVAEDGSLQEIQIELGLQGDEVSEVKAGLEVDDVLAVNLGGDSLSNLFGG